SATPPSPTCRWGRSAAGGGCSTPRISAAPSRPASAHRPAHTEPAPSRSRGSRSCHEPQRQRPQTTRVRTRPLTRSTRTQPSRWVHDQEPGMTTTRYTVRPRKRAQLWGIPFLIPAVALLTFVILVPAVRGVGYAFTDWNGLSADFNWIGFDNFVK